MNTETSQIDEYNIEDLKNLVADFQFSIELEEAIHGIITYSSSINDAPTEADFRDLKFRDRSIALDLALRAHDRDVALLNTYKDFIFNEAKRALMRVRAGYGYGVLPKRSTASLIKDKRRKVQMCGLYLLNREYADAEVISVHEDELYQM